MAYINEVQIKAAGANIFSPYLIEPTLYIKPTLNNSAYSYSDNSSSLKNFELVNGVAIQVEFAATNPANATLNINNKGAKPIYYENSTVSAGLLSANRIYTLVYDSANSGRWYIVGDIDTNTTYTNGTGLNLTGTTFSVKYGNTEGTAAQGNDSRLSDARTPTSHSHGNITNDGKVGTGNTLLKTVNGEIQAGPAIGADDTKFLNNKGEWAVPTYTVNTDEKVKQTPTTTDASYELLFSESANNNQLTEGARKTSTLKYNPSSKTLTIDDGTLTGTNYSGKSANATAADAFSSNAKVELTGDVTGSKSSTKGWTISTTIANKKVTPAKMSDDATIGIGTQAIKVGDSFNTSTLLTDLGLSSALHYRGASNTIPPSSGTYSTGDVLIDSTSSKEYVYDGTTWRELGDESSFKIKQTVVNSPSVPDSGTTTATAFIDSISQDVEGVITATKKNLPIASTTTAGIIQIGTEATNAAAGNHTHYLNNLTKKGLTTSTINTNTTTDLIYSSSAGKFFGHTTNYDWVGIQIGTSNDRFQLIAQLIADSNTLIFRQNDNNSVSASNWSAWQQFVHTPLVGGIGGAGAQGSKTAGEEAVATPVYITANGTASPIAYSIGSDVPIGAVFTDHYDWSDITNKPTIVNSVETGTANGKIKIIPSSGDAYEVSVYGLGSNAFNSTAYLPLSGGTMTGNINLETEEVVTADIALANSGTKVVQILANTSNWGIAIGWNKKTAYTNTYIPGIGFHNTGQTISIVPYATNTKPWGRAVGLSIGASDMKFENHIVAHAGNVSTGDNNGQIKIAGANVTVKGISDLAYIAIGSGSTKFLREDGTWQTALTAHQDLSTYAPLASPALTGTPTAPTAANGTNTTQIATTEFVNNTLAYANAMTFKGTLGTGGTVTTLPDSHKAGDTYRVITTGTYADMYCEVGTLIICITDGTTASDTDWTSVETNEDGSVIGPASSTDTHIAIFDGASGRIIKDSGFTIATSVPSSAVFTDVNVTATANTATTFYLIGASGSSTATGTMLKSKDIWYTSNNTSGNRRSELVLGNSTSTGSSGGRHGMLSLYSTGTKGTTLAAAANSTAWYTATLPAKTGTLVMGATTTTQNAIAIYSDETGTLANSSSTINSDGEITATAFNGPLTGDVSGNADTATGANLTTTANNIAYYSNTTGTFANGTGVQYLNVNGTKTGKAIGLSITGTAYNAAAELASGTDGILGFGDPGPQIRFKDDTQSGVILFHRWNNGSASVSFNFLSNEGGDGALVRAGNFIANNRIYIGTNTLGTAYNLSVNGNTLIGYSTLSNTAFTNDLVLYANQNNESTTTSFDATKSSWGIGFKRKWNSGTEGAVHAGIYAYGISNWRAGLAFRVKTGTISTDTHDTTALYLNHDGAATFASTISATEFLGGRLTHVGMQSTWRQGRDNALVAITSANAYSPLTSIKTENGSWELGAYKTTGSIYTDRLLVTYFSDATYDATSNNNSISAQIMITKEGSIYPFASNNPTLGTSSYKWSNVYATTFTGEATNVTTTANTTNTMYLVGVKSGATTTLLHDTKITAAGSVLTIDTLTITGGATNASMSSSGTLTIGNATKALTVSTTTAALTISTGNGALEAKSTGTGTVKLTSNSGAMTLSTTSGNMSLSSGGTVSIDSGSNKSLTIGAGSTVSISATTTMTINSTTSTSISATTTMSISGTQGTTINSGSGYATVFKINNTEYGRFNTSGMFQLNDTGTQNTHKLYVNGDSAFNGKIAIGAQTSNTITENVYMQWNTTDQSLDFIFP